MRAGPQRHILILEYWKEQLDFDSQEKCEAMVKKGGWKGAFEPHDK